MKTTFKQARKIIRQKLQNYYGSHLHEIKSTPALKPLRDTLVMDAYIGDRKNFRITIHYNERVLREDEAEQLYINALRQLADSPERHIIICQYTGEYGADADWLLEDYYNIEKTEGLWLLPFYEQSRTALDATATELFSILDGRRFKIGCRPGAGNPLTMLMTPSVCPECGETIWVPESVLIPIFRLEDPKIKVWLTSFESILKYYPTTIKQMADIYNAQSEPLGKMQMNTTYGFHISCHKCGTVQRDYGEADCRYFQHELPPTWSRWAVLDTIPDDIRLLPLDTVRLDVTDVRMICDNITCMEGFVFMDTYLLSELVEKPCTECSIEELMHNALVTHRHLKTFPPFRMVMGNTLAEFDSQLVYSCLNAYLSAADMIIRSE